MKYRVQFSHNKRHKGRPWWFTYTLRHRGTVQRMLWAGNWWFCVRNKASAQAIKEALG